MRSLSRSDGGMVKITRSAHTYPFPRNDPLSPQHSVSPLLRTWRNGGEKKGSARICEKPFSRVAGEKEVWGGPRDMVKEPLGWFSFLRHRHGVGLFKKNVAVAVVVCFFIDRTWRISPAKLNLFALSYVYVHSNAIRYFHLHNFCGGGWMRAGGREGKWVIFYGTSAEYNGDLVIIIREMLMLSSFYIRLAISAYSLGEPCMFRRGMSGL